MKPSSSMVTLLASIVLASPATLLLAYSERVLCQPTFAHRGVFPTIRDRDFVPGGTRTVTGRIESMASGNPTSWLRISDGLTSWNLMLPASHMLTRFGVSLDSLSRGSRITVVLTVDASGSLSTDGALIGRVESIMRVSD